MNGTVDDEKKKELIEVIKKVKFQPYKHFTGIEWWNKTANVPYPVRHHVEFSMLRYAPHVDSTQDLEMPSYKPYTSLAEDKDLLGKQYPVAFENLREMDGCICYEVNSGVTYTGMTYSLKH